METQYHGKKETTRERSFVQRRGKDFTCVRRHKLSQPDEVRQVLANHSPQTKSGTLLFTKTYELKRVDIFFNGWGDCFRNDMTHENINSNLSFCHFIKTQLRSRPSALPTAALTLWHRVQRWQQASPWPRSSRTAQRGVVTQHFKGHRRIHFNFLLITSAPLTCQNKKSEL